MDQNIATLQATLHAIGYDAGKVDGVWGDRTRQAMQDMVNNYGKGIAVQKPTGGPQIVKGILQGAGHPVNEIIVHCAATPVGWYEGRSLEDKIKEITAWHKARGFSTIGYHWVIDRDGRVLPGRPETQIGAHVEGHNTGTIGISLIGGATSKETDPFSKNYTPAQDAALRKLIGEIKGRANITKISGHNQYASKACPGFNVPQWLAEK